MKKILILTCSAGNGHNSASKRLKDMFLSKGNYEVEIFDVYKNCGSFIKNWLQTTGYMIACNHLCDIYNYFYKKNETKDFTNPEKNHVNKNSYALTYKLLKKIYDYKPDLIFSTYIYNSVAIENLKRVFKIPAKVASLTLDYGISPYWECTSKSIDYMFLTGEYMIKPFIERGFNKSKLYPVGIPVAKEFENLPSKEECLKELNLKSDMFTLLVMKSGFFGIKDKSLIKSFKKIKKPIQIVIVNGNHKKSKNKIDRLLKRYHLLHNVINLGYTDKVTKYFAVSNLILNKAGGLTTTETINACKPSLIVDKLPQQEIYNKDFMINNNLAMCVNKHNLAKTINSLLDNNNMLTNMQQNLQKVRKLNTLDNIYQVLKDCKDADYSNINTTLLSKHKFIKLIDKQRKLELKRNKKAL